ncbi:MAG: SAM-dependent chlorinase/fluorinase [Gammaproteobacteria bacterium]|nr:SAM-dependent chlorinase/fluorinase [Gammaproteobacteria bacterium]
MIVTFTDFGWRGPYIGELELCLSRAKVPVIHLFRDAPRFNPGLSAHLIAPFVSRFPKHTVFLGVVDPGVGTDSRNPVVLFADDQWFVGPGNGLFDVIAARATSQVWFDIHWRPEQLSSTFHGRDLFAPIAVHIAQKHNVDTVCKENSLRLDASFGKGINRIIYIDSFGNCITGVRAEDLTSGSTISVNGRQIRMMATFGDVAQGEALCFFNSSGLLEIAVNQGSAEEKLGLRVGSDIEFI